MVLCGGEQRWKCRIRARGNTYHLVVGGEINARKARYVVQSQ